MSRKASLNCHLSFFLPFFFFLRGGLLVPVCGKGNSIPPSRSSWLSLSRFSPSPSLPPWESGSILLFRFLLAAEKAGQMWQIWSYVKITPNHTKVFHLIDSWPSGSANPKLGFSFLSLSLSFFGDHSQFSKNRAQALKSTLSLIQ